MALIDAGVTVALGVTDAWQVPHTRFDAAWVSTYMDVLQPYYGLALTLRISIGPIGCARVGRQP